MPDYSKTVIYKIQHENDESLLYVGSTTNFTTRKCQHKNNTKNSNGKQYNDKLYKMIRENGGFESFNMIQIKEFPCSSKREAEKEEDNVMLKLKATMNDRRACRSLKEYYEDNREEILKKTKQYRDENRENILDKQKNYRKNNRSKIAENNALYRIKNVEKIRNYKKQYAIDNSKKLVEKMTQYRIDNIDKINERTKQKEVCECGSAIQRCEVTRHRKSKKHLKLLGEIKI